MEEMVIKYLDRNYTMTYGSYLSGAIIDTETKRSRLITDLREDLIKIFSLEDREAHSIANTWWDKMELPFIKEELANLR